MQGNNLGPHVSGLLTSWEGPTDVFGQDSQRTGLGGKQKHKEGETYTGNFGKNKLKKKSTIIFFSSSQN